MRGFSIKRLLPRTLLGRSLLILVTPVVLIQVITTYMFFDRHWNKMASRLAYAVSGEVAMLVAMTRDGGASTLFDEAERYSRQYLEVRAEYYPSGMLPDRRGLSGGPIWETVMAKKLRSEIAAQIKEPFVIHTRGEDASEGGAILVYVQVGQGLLKVSFPERRLFSSSGYIFLMWVMGSSLLLLLAAILFMRNQIRPIRKLAVAAERFGRGRDTPSFKPEGALEVRQAARAFLEMRSRIQRQISQRTEMLAGVSHDLRTPLTRMKLQLELLPDSPDVRELKSDVQDMQKMIQGYLDFVRGDGEESYGSVDLAALLEKLAGGARREGRSVVLNVRDVGKPVVRPLAFERALANLVGNAVKYAQNLWISAYEDDGYLCVVIEDDGPGVPEDMYEEVFKPFTRVDSSRNAETGGVGLGLPIAADIIHAHGGHISLGRSAHGGLSVSVNIPV